MTVPVHGLPPLLRADMEVAVVPPPLRETRWHTVVSADDSGSGQLVQLSGIRDIGAAEALVGTTLLADRSQLPEDYLLHDRDGLMGRSVIDENHGDLGGITDVLVGSAQDVWVVEGPYGEVLIPAVEAFVRQVPEAGPISVCVPEGTVSTEEE